MRNLIIKKLTTLGYCYSRIRDYCFERGDLNAYSYKDYKSWLESLRDEDLLDAYDRIKEVEFNCT